MWQDIIKAKVVKAGKKSVNRVLFRNAMYDVTSQYLTENHSGDELTINKVVELKDPLKLLGIQKLKDDGYEGRMLGNFQSWWINQFERQLPAVLNKMIRLRLADKGAGIGENKGTTAYLLKAKNVRLKKKILQLLEGEDWLSTQQIMGKLIDIKFRDTPSNSNALSMIVNQIKEVDSRRVTNRGIVIDPSVVNYLTIRHIKQFKLKGEDIIKSGNRGKRPNKVKGEILRTVVSEYLEETGYRDYYIIGYIGDAFEKIYPRYLALHAPEAAATSKYKLLERKVLQSLPSYFPSPYVSKSVSKNNIIYRIVVKENIDLTNFGERMILKAARGKKSSKVKGEILRPLVIEYLEETGYRDYYITNDVLEEIFPRYLALHKETLPKGSYWLPASILKRKIDFMLNSYFPSSYVSKSVSKNNIIYRIVVKENIDLTNFGERMILKRNVGKKPHKIKSEILRPLVIEYLEKTGYRDYYFFSDAFEEIYPKYLVLHKEEISKYSVGLRVQERIVEGRVNDFLSQYFPSQYKKSSISFKSTGYRLMVNKNVSERDIKIQALAMLESKMSKAYDPKPPNKVTPNMEEDIDYVTGENEYENNPTLSQKIKQILSLKPIPYSPKKPKKEDVDKEDNCGCNSCNDVSKGKKKSSKCTGRTKKTSSKVKGKKWTQCVPTGEKGKYRRANWGQAGVKVTGDSGNTKRKKSFRARHKCKTCKLDNGPKRYYSNQCLACRDW